MHYIICFLTEFQDNFRKFSREHHEDEVCNAFQAWLNVCENWPDFQDPMDPGKDASNHLKLGTAFLYSAAICMHYRQLGCAKSVVNYRMSKLLKPAFAAQIQVLKDV
jgi:hypothetical protein